MSPEYAFSVDKLPVFAEIEAAAKKYGVNLPVDTLTLGWASGMMLEAALKQCGCRAPGRSCLDALNTANVETAGIYPDPVNWTKDDHTRPASFTAYAWDAKASVGQAHHRMGEGESRRPRHGQGHRLSRRDGARAMNLLLVILIQASFYALLGMGYVLIYRATRVLNLAHGDLMVFGAFLFYQALVVSNGNLPLSVIAGLAGRGAARRADLPRHHASAGGLSGRGRRAGHDRARHPAALHRDADLVGTDPLSGRISRAARPARSN